MEAETVYFEDYRLPKGLVRIKGKYPTLRTILKQLNKIYTRDMIEDHDGFTHIYVRYTNNKMMIVYTSWDS